MIDKLLERDTISESDPNVVFGLTATVASDGQMDLYQHLNESHSFETVKSAIRQVRDELTRILERGPLDCPYRNHSPTPE